MVTPTNHVIAGPDLHRAGPLALKGFRKIFLPNIGEEKKKSHRLSARPWHCAIEQIRLWLLHYVY